MVRGHIAARSHYDEMMSNIDAWATLAAMVGIEPPPHEWVGNDGKPIYFDSIDNSAYILGKDQHSVRKSWIYIDGEVFQGAPNVDPCRGCRRCCRCCQNRSACRRCQPIHAGEARSRPWRRESPRRRYSTS